MRLAGKTAIVTGAASGMGRAAALLFAAEGASVVVADVNEEGGRAVVRGIEAAGGQGLFVRADVSETADVQALVRAAIERFGRLTTLYNNAAPVDLVNTADRSVTELPEEVFDRTCAVILRGTFLVCKYGIPELVRAGGGSVVNTSTVDAVVGQGGYDAYAAAKGGVLSLTRSTAVAYASYRVRVNAILPGFVRTPATEAWLAREPSRRAIEALHLTRIGEPEDIARFALYLASDESEYVTGGWHMIDGGFTAFKTPVTDYGGLE
ncbi:MAG: SDR family oxidoreductase [Actinomycetota bacterium]|nr:SDR family oxidoreductase [Actinomycetota bacterium]